MNADLSLPLPPASWKRGLKDLLYALGFPLYSLFSSRVGLTFFYKRAGQWRARSRGRSFDVPEPRLWVLEYFRHFLPAPGAVVFDVGGEFGRESAQFAELVGRQGRVFVFECMPEHVQRLRRLAQQHPQIAVVDRACWNADTELKFFLGNTPGSNTAVPDAKGQRGQSLAREDADVLLVQAQRLDSLWQELHAGRPVDFLKMDIEGAEYEALEGAREMLAQTRRAVIASYHLRDGVPTASRVDAMLREAGFHTRVDENLHVYAWR
jgi:FkbM family methyltransferase